MVQFQVCHITQSILNLTNDVHSQVSCCVFTDICTPDIIPNIHSIPLGCQLSKMINDNDSPFLICGAVQVDHRWRHCDPYDITLHQLTLICIMEWSPMNVYFIRYIIELMYLERKAKWCGLLSSAFFCGFFFFFFFYLKGCLWDPSEGTGF